MDTFNAPTNPISVLVVDGEPSILISIARILDASGMRALLARNGGEAVAIAERYYIPIDLMLTNTAIPELHEPELLNQLRRIRPGVRHLSMAASVDGRVTRIQLMTGGPGVEYRVCDDTLAGSIRKAASAPYARGAGMPN
jgi:response regulator RpfG family c-di-GMP phosphodiesterase